MPLWSVKRSIPQELDQLSIQISSALIKEEANCEPFRPTASRLTLVSHAQEVEPLRRHRSVSLFFYLLLLGDDQGGLGRVSDARGGATACEGEGVRSGRSVAGVVATATAECG